MLGSGFLNQVPTYIRPYPLEIVYNPGRAIPESSSFGSRLAFPKVALALVVFQGQTIYEEDKRNLRVSVIEDIKSSSMFYYALSIVTIVLRKIVIAITFGYVYTFLPQHT